MLRIALVNMPFAAVHLPSIALVQLRARVERELGDRARTRLLYLNHDVAGYLGLEVYRLISHSLEASHSGLGDWFFRQQAYPELADNTREYVERYLWKLAAQHPGLVDLLAEKRQGLGAFLEDLVDRYGLDRYDVVGFTSMFMQSVACFALARRLKERRPAQRVVMGGANCETPMGRVIAGNVPHVDYVFSGPSLKSFPELVRLLEAGEEERCDEIRGVLSARKVAGQDPSSLRREIGEELPITTEVPVAYDDFLASLDDHFPRGSVEPAVLFETSRGCWWGERAHCTFCGLNGLTMQYRSMPAVRALEQFETLFRYTPPVTRFEAVDNIMPREYLTEVFPHLVPPEGVGIFYEVKADLKDHEMEILARAGVNQIQPGIEALATSTLKLMKKGTTAFQNLRFLRNCLDYGIAPQWNLLVGFPGEGEEVYRKYTRDLPALAHLPPPSGVFPVRFDRFSPYHKLAQEYGLELAPYDFYGMIYPYSAADLEDLAYYFADATVDAPYVTAMVRWIHRLRRQVEAWQQRWSQAGSVAAIPQLVFRGEGERRVVYDSRLDRGEEIALEPLDLELLDRLAEPRKEDRLRQVVEGLAPAALRDRLEALRERGLVFEEGDRYLSLVMDRPPSDEFIKVSSLELRRFLDATGGRGGEEAA